MPANRWGLLLIALITSICFVLLGIYLGRFLPRQKFRRLILFILFGLALKLGWMGIAGIFMIT